MKNVFLALIMAALLHSCGADAIYEKSIDMRKRYWIADSVYNFEFNVEDTSGIYDIFFTVRNTSEYPFYNLYAVYGLTDSTGRTMSHDMINFELFHPKTGEPHGGGLGSIYSHKLPLLTQIDFSHSGKYQVTLEQNMRLDSLRGIVSIGISVEKSTESN